MACARFRRYVGASYLSARDDTTLLLKSWAGGDAEAGERLSRRLFPELRRLSLSRLHGVDSEISLQPTEVVNELYLKLVHQRVGWKSRAHFFALAARMIRRILLDHVRAKGRQKRAGHAESLTLIDQEIGFQASLVELLDLEGALSRLAEADPIAAQIIELRYFGGLTFREIAAVTGRGPATVFRLWQSGRHWLRAELDTPGA